MRKPAAAAPAANAASAAKKPAPGGSAGKPSGKAASSAAAVNLDTVKYKHSSEDAEALAADLIPPSVMTGLGDANWKARLAALEEMTTWLEAEVDSLDAEVIVRALAKKGWNEKNFQVSLSSSLVGASAG